jgi:hypothetical protein
MIFKGPLLRVACTPVFCVIRGAGLEDIGCWFSIDFGTILSSVWRVSSTSKWVRRAIYPARPIIISVRQALSILGFVARFNPVFGRIPTPFLGIFSPILSGVFGHRLRSRICHIYPRGAIHPCPGLLVKNSATKNGWCWICHVIGQRWMRDSVVTLGETHRAHLICRIPRNGPWMPLISSIMNTVLPTPAPPNRPIFPP